MKKILTTLIIVIPLLATSQIAKDKKLHFSAGVLSAEVGSILYQATSGSKDKDFYVRVASGVITGIGKELYDDKFDVVDASYGVAGAIASQLTHLVLPRKWAQVINIGASSAHLVTFKFKI